MLTTRTPIAIARYKLDVLNLDSVDQDDDEEYDKKLIKESLLEVPSSSHTGSLAHWLAGWLHKGVSLCPGYFLCFRHVPIVLPSITQ